MKKLMSRLVTGEPAEIGSKRWYRDKRVAHISLWFVPWTPVLYASAIQDWNDPVKVVALVWTPWVLSGAVLAMMCRALWRIEINVAANKDHPFTEKDGRVLWWAGLATLAVMILAVFFLMFAQVDGITDRQQASIDNAINGTLILMLAIGTVGGTMHRIHRKGMHVVQDLRKAIEELEKGV